MVAFICCDVHRGRMDVLICPQRSEETFLFQEPRNQEVSPVFL